MAALVSKRYGVVKIVAIVILVVLVVSVCGFVVHCCVVWCGGNGMEMEGRRRSRGARRAQEKADLSRLATFVYSKSAPSDAADCAVCLSEFRDGDALRLLPNCSHSFHTACVDLWFASHSTCPLCRSPVSAHSLPPSISPS